MEMKRDQTDRLDLFLMRSLYAFCASNERNRFINEPLLLWGYCVTSSGPC
jgi:hypothetical protein